jgi:hypothetical protein
VSLKNFCHTSPAFASWPIIGSAVCCLSTSVLGSGQPRVRAVSTAPRRCIVFVGAQLPTCRLAGRKLSCVCTSGASSAGMPAVHSTFSPSRFPYWSRSVGATVGASAWPSGTRAGRRRPCRYAARAGAGPPGESSGDGASDPWYAFSAPCGATSDWARRMGLAARPTFRDYCV